MKFLLLFLVLTLSFSSSSYSQKSEELDLKEFAPGYPNYSLSTIEQLQSFPSPRFGNGQLLKNFPWMDINYLHREYPKSYRGTGISRPLVALNLIEEMVKYWNYYLEIPILRLPDSLTSRLYEDSSLIYKAIFEFANGHPEYKTSSILYQIQNDDRHAGFLQKLYVTSQMLPSEYYLKDGNNIPIYINGKKWLSPLCPLDSIKNDGITSGYYLKNAVKYLKRPIDFINENGEIFGHKRTEEMLFKDKQVKNFSLKNGFSNDELNGYFQNRLDSTYKSMALKVSKLDSAKFSFFNVSEVQNHFWPSYKMRRNLLVEFNNYKYSTPSFYPIRPAYWETVKGPWNGFGIIADGRRRENLYGDSFFSPFVSAGWDKEEFNIRPTQWLSLLKAMTMLGADFFYVGYFNVTGARGWANGYGPNDPRGYIYQVAIPSYAQSIAQKFRNFVEFGRLLNPRSEKEWLYTYRFKGNRTNQLILVRQLGNSYLIQGSIQITSNFNGELVEEEITSIKVNDIELTFPIRRQGSTYILNFDFRPVFYQLDGWHETGHPSFWSKTVTIEGELPDSSFNSTIFTDNFISKSSGKVLDFSKAYSFIRMDKNAYLEFNVPIRKKGYYNLEIIARSYAKAPIKILINGKIRTIKVLRGGWKKYKLADVWIDGQKSLNEYSDKLKFATMDLGVDIDKIVFSSKLR